MFQVANMRNSLSHMGINKGGSIDDTSVLQYFTDIKDLMDSLQLLHPTVISLKMVADLKTQLDHVS